MIDKTPTPKAGRDPLPPFTPVPRAHKRHDGWTPERQQGFIEALADTGSVRSAARAVGMSEVGAYQLRRHPEGGEFARAWERALKLGVQRLEDVALERALYGVEVPVYHFGAVVGTRRVYNNRLVMFMLRNRAPKRFKADSLQKTEAVTKGQLEKLKKQWHAEWEPVFDDYDDDDPDDDGGDDFGLPESEADDTAAPDAPPPESPPTGPRIFSFKDDGWNFRTHPNDGRCTPY